MARLTDEERSFIKEYVDSKYYDIGKLLSYLEMHQMVAVWSIKYHLITCVSVDC